MADILGNASLRRTGTTPWRASLIGAAAIVLAYLATALLASPATGERFASWLGLGTSLAVAAALLWVSTRCRAAGHRLARAWGIIGLAYLAYALADFLGVALGVSLDQPPASYLLHGAYLLFYPLFLVGVLSFPARPLSSSERLRLLLDMAIVVLAAGVILWTLLATRLFAHEAVGQPRAAVIALYPLGGLGLLYALLVLLFERRDPSAVPMYRLLALGTALLILSDGNYVFQVLSGRHRLAFWTGVGWTVSHLLVGLAAIRQLDFLGRSEQPVPERRWRVATERTSLYLAFGCLLGAWVVLLVRYPGGLSVVTAAGVVAMVGVALGRQLVGLKENERLNDGLRRARDELEDRIKERTAQLAQANVELASEVGERKRAAAALRDSESRYRSLFLDSPISLWEEDFSGAKQLLDELDPTARGDLEAFLQAHPDLVVRCARAVRIVDVNHATLALFGVAGKEELIDGIRAIFGEGTFASFRAELVALASGRTSFGGEANLMRLTGEPIKASYQLALAPGFERSWAKVFVSVIDVTERAEAEDALQRSEERFRALVQNSHDLITIHDAEGRVIYQSPAVERLLGYGPDGLLGRHPIDFTHPQDVDTVRAGLARVAAGVNTGIPTEFRFRRSDGTWAYLESVGANLLSHPGIMGLVLTTRDIGERKRAEAEIRGKLRELTLLSAAAAIASEAHDEESLTARTTEAIRDVLFPDNCGIMLLDEKSRVLRYTPSYHTFSEEDREITIPLGSGITGSVALSGVARLVPDTAADKDYLALDPDMRSELCVPLKVGDRVLGVIDAESRALNAFTPGDQRVVETLANQLATALERLRGVKALRENEERLRTLSEATFEGIGFSEDGRTVDVNSRMAEMLGYSVAEMVGRPTLDFVAPESRHHVAERIRSGSDEPYEHLALRKDASVFPVEARTRELPYAGRATRVTAIRDISERRRAEAEVHRQLERLAILRRIDASIAANVDLPVTLGLIIDELIAQLGVAAAGILVLDADQTMLTFAAGRGFRSDVYRSIRIPLAESFAGHVMRERRTFAVLELDRSPAGFSLSGFMRMEGFETYLAAPLMAKGEVNGVLEVFHNAPIDSDGRWVGFLEALAGQAAIAIDNISLLDGIRRTNKELAAAYDTTLEGWSRALELRDRETQGHTLRVTEMTMRLGREIGMSDEDLVHLRRGALLHDIGKVAIPDSILFKPGQLNDEEWAIMRRHTVYAHDLLEPIAYLRPAIAIPHCHHERWDGRGYPRGLQGEAIPLAARVFAVVDTWDALCSDRPYRAAWPRDEVLQYLRDHAGRMFDPRVVATFVRLLGQA